MGPGSARAQELRQAIGASGEGVLAARELAGEQHGYEHPVAEAAVVGIPHDELGEEIGAAVALRTGDLADPDELRNFVSSRLGGVQVSARRLARGQSSQGVYRQDPAPRGRTAVGAARRCA